MPKKKLSKKGARARAELRDRIKHIQAQEDFDPLAGELDAMDSLLKEEVADVEEMRKWLRVYDGDHPLLAKYRQELLANPQWVPSKRQRVLFFSARQNRGGLGSLRNVGSTEYMRILDDDGTGYDPDEPDSMDPPDF